MAEFTIKLKDVIAFTGGTIDMGSAITTMTGGNIGLDSYPLFDNAYRIPLNGKIIDHFWNREIGVETIDMFQMVMRRKMNEIMPPYNKLYLSEKIVYDPLSTMDITTVSSGTLVQDTESESNTHGTSESENKSRTVNQDYPQSMLAGNDDYASSGVDSTGTGTADSTGTDNSTSNTNNTSNNTNSSKGYQGSAADLLQRYRSAILNIDLAIIEDLENCFMSVWTSSDEYAIRDLLI